MMAKRILFIGLLLVVNANGAKPCDCTVTPYTPNPPCWSVCVSRILALAKPAELQTSFGLKESLAKTVAGKTKKDGKALSLEDFKTILSGPDYEELERCLNGMNQKQLTEFEEALKKRSMTLNIPAE